MPYGPYTLQSYPCAICGCADSTTIGSKRGSVVDRDFALVRCAECRHVYVNPRISDEQLGELYDDDYYRGRGFDPSVDYFGPPSPFTVSENAGVIHTVQDALKRPLRDATWIDVGCGSGTLVKRLTELGVLAVGTETSETAVRACARLGAPLIDDAEVERRRGTFDVASAVEVIEHLSDPRGFVAYLASLVRVGGVVYIQTGNWEVVRRFPGTPYIMPEGHIAFFTPQRLRALYAEAGLEEIFVLNRSWFPWRWLPQTVKRYAPVAAFAWLARIFGWIAPNYGQLPVAVRVR